VIAGVIFAATSATYAEGTALRLLAIAYMAPCQRLPSGAIARTGWPVTSAIVSKSRS